MKILLATLTLSLSRLPGCGGMRRVDAQVSSTSVLPADTGTLKGARYRFDRLPSQSGQPEAQRLEAMVQSALAQVALPIHPAACAGWMSRSHANSSYPHIHGTDPYPCHPSW